MKLYFHGFVLCFFTLSATVTWSYRGNFDLNKHNKCLKQDSACSTELLKKDRLALNSDRLFGALPAVNNYCGAYFNYPQQVDRNSALMEISELSAYLSPQVNSCLEADFNLSLDNKYRYAYLQSRLDYNAQKLAEYIGQSDLLLGLKPLDNLNCKEGELLRTELTCAAFQAQCVNKNLRAPDLVASQTVVQYESARKRQDIDKIEAQIVSIENDIKIKDYRPDNEQNRQNLESEKKLLPLLKLKLVMFYSQYPWAAQQTYVEKKKNGSDTLEAFRAQVKENRMAAQLKLNRLQFASLCINKSDCSIDSFYETLEQTDEIPDLKFEGSRLKTSKKNHDAVQSIVNGFNCLYDLKFSQNKSTSTIISSAAMAVSSLLTIGGSVVLGGLSIGNKLLISETSLLRKTSSVGKLMLQSSNGIDAVISVEMLSSAAKQCLITSDVKIKTGKQFSESKISCLSPTSDSQAVDVIEHQQNCMLDVLASGAGVAISSLAILKGGNSYSKKLPSGSENLRDVCSNPKSESCQQGLAAMGVTINKDGFLQGVTGKDKTEISDVIEDLRKNHNIEISSYASMRSEIDLHLGVDGKHRMQIGSDFVSHPQKSLLELKSKVESLNEVKHLKSMGIYVPVESYVNTNKAILKGDPKGARLSRMIDSLSRRGVRVHLDKQQFSKSDGSDYAGFAVGDSDIYLSPSIMRSSPEYIEQVLVHEVKHISSIRKNIIERTIYIKNQNGQLPFKSYSDYYRTDELEARIVELANQDFYIKKKGTHSRQLEKKELIKSTENFLLHQKSVFNKINAESLKKAKYEKGEDSVSIPVVDDAKREITVEFKIDPESPLSATEQAVLAVKNRLRQLDTLQKRLNQLKGK